MVTLGKGNYNERILYDIMNSTKGTEKQEIRGGAFPLYKTIPSRYNKIDFNMVIKEINVGKIYDTVDRLDADLNKGQDINIMNGPERIMTLKGALLNVEIVRIYHGNNMAIVNVRGEYYD